MTLWLKRRAEERSWQHDIGRLMEQYPELTDQATADAVMSLVADLGFDPDDRVPALAVEVALKAHLFDKVAQVDDLS